jgi:peptide deformylase
MRYLDENFVEHDEEFTGKPARVIQHEYDHIEGKVFTDHLVPLRRNLIKNKLQKMARRDKSLVDKVSAAIILQDYMASVGM